MRTLLILFVNISMINPISFAQYDDGTIIYSETNQNHIQKNYKVVDFDGDNFIDILFIKDGNPNQLCWYKGDGNGNFIIQDDLLNVYSSYLENEIFYEDMNADDIDDIVFQNSNTGFTALINDGQGNISEQIETEIKTTEEFIGIDLKDIADIDGDGNVDAVIFASKEETHWIPQGERDLGYCLLGYNNGNGNFADYKYLDNNEDLFGQIKTGDINNDGDIDIVFSGHRGEINSPSYGHPFIRLYENLGTGKFADKVEMDLPEVKQSKPIFTHIFLQDINGGAALELLAEYAYIFDCDNIMHLEGCSYNNKLHIMEYDVENAPFAETETYNSWIHGYTFPNFLNYSANNAFSIQFGLYDNDENLDILSVSIPQGKLQWHLGNGKGDFDTNRKQVVHTNKEYKNNKPVLQVADVDNDIDLDVFVLLNTETSSTLTLFKNLAQPTQEPIVNQLILTPNPVAADSFMQFNFDENQDFITISYSLYSLAGSKIINGTIEQGKIYIPNIHTGIYLIAIDLDDQKYINKLIVY